MFMFVVVVVVGQEADRANVKMNKLTGEYAPSKRGGMAPRAHNTAT